MIPLIGMVEERRRLILWAVMACMFMVSLPIALGRDVPGEVGLAAWTLFIAGLVLIGMVLVGALMLVRGRGALVIVAGVVAAFIALFAANGLDQTYGQ
jgi:hypothetical protein